MRSMACLKMFFKKKKKSLPHSDHPWSQLWDILGKIFLVRSEVSIKHSLDIQQPAEIENVTWKTIKFIAVVYYSIKCVMVQHKSMRYWLNISQGIIFKLIHLCGDIDQISKNYTFLLKPKKTRKPLTLKILVYRSVGNPFVLRSCTISKQGSS